MRDVFRAPSSLTQPIFFIYHTETQENSNIDLDVALRPGEDERDDLKR